MNKVIIVAPRMPLKNPTLLPAINFFLDCQNLPMERVHVRAYLQRLCENEKLHFFNGLNGDLLRIPTIESVSWISDADREGVAKMM